MQEVQYPFRILIIDDDLNLCKDLKENLKGLITNENGLCIHPEVDFINVVLARKENETNKWEFDSNTLNGLNHVNKLCPYDLVICDYGFITTEGKSILWADGNSKPTIEDVKGILFTIADLKNYYEKEFAKEFRKGNRLTIFNSTKRMILRSFASRNAYDILGPFKNREKVTKGVFPNAHLEVMDTRQEYYSHDKYYDLYDDPRYGRPYYRSLVLSSTSHIVQGEIYHFITSLVHKSRLRRSIFNITLYTGFVAAIGLSAQFLADIGIKELRNENPLGVIFIVFGLVTIILGALALTAYFEKFSRSIIHWFNSEES